MPSSKAVNRTSPICLPRNWFRIAMTGIAHVTIRIRTAINMYYALKRNERYMARGTLDTCLKALIFWLGKDANVQAAIKEGYSITPAKEFRP